MAYHTMYFNCLVGFEDLLNYNILSLISKVENQSWYIMQKPVIQLKLLIVYGGLLKFVINHDQTVNHACMYFSILC
jgi:hypothetical protein